MTHRNLGDLNESRAFLQALLWPTVIALAVIFIIAMVAA
jgi:hypothetical protein